MKVRTPHINGLIDVRLTKAETTKLDSVAETCNQLSILAPLKPGVNDAAATAAEALRCLKELVGCDVSDYAPLLDNAEENPIAP
jgi:hypothetical protein